MYAYLPRVLVLILLSHYAIYDTSHKTLFVPTRMPLNASCDVPCGTVFPYDALCEHRRA